MKQTYRFEARNFAIILASILLMLSAKSKATNENDPKANINNQRLPSPSLFLQTDLQRKVALKETDVILADRHGFDWILRSCKLYRLEDTELKSIFDVYPWINKEELPTQCTYRVLTVTRDKNYRTILSGNNGIIIIDDTKKRVINILEKNYLEGKIAHINFASGWLCATIYKDSKILLWKMHESELNSENPNFSEPIIVDTQYETTPLLIQANQAEATFFIRGKQNFLLNINNNGEVTKKYLDLPNVGAIIDFADGPDGSRWILGQHAILRWNSGQLTEYRSELQKYLFDGSEHTNLASSKYSLTFTRNPEILLIRRMRHPYIIEWNIANKSATPIRLPLSNNKILAEQNQYLIDRRSVFSDARSEIYAEQIGTLNYRLHQSYFWKLYPYEEILPLDGGLTPDRIVKIKNKPAIYVDRDLYIFDARTGPGSNKEKINFRQLDAGGKASIIIPSHSENDGLCTQSLSQIECKVPSGSPKYFPIEKLHAQGVNQLHALQLKNNILYALVYHQNGSKIAYAQLDFMSQNIKLIELKKDMIQLSEYGKLPIIGYASGATVPSFYFTTDYLGEPSIAAWSPKEEECCDLLELPNELNKYAEKEKISLKLMDSRSRHWIAYNNNLYVATEVENFSSKKDGRKKLTAQRIKLNNKDITLNVTEAAEDYAGNIWILSDDGLLKIDPTSLEVKLANIPNSLISSSSSLVIDNTFGWLQTKFGLLRFQPNRFEEFPQPKSEPVVSSIEGHNGPTIQGERFQFLNSSYPDEFRLKAYSSITISMMFPNAIPTHVNHYKYTISKPEVASFDQPWIELQRGSSKIELKDIAPGKHKIRFAARHPLGEWVNGPTEILINVDEPFYWTNFAKAAYVLIGIAAIYLIIILFKSIEVRRQRRQFIQETIRISRIDHLTGLINRRYFEEKLNEKLAVLNGRYPSGHTIIDQELIAIVSIDLDKFKLINDRFGHRVGDKYLCHTAKILSRFESDTVLVARLGGDEFSLAVLALNSVDYEYKTNSIVTEIVQYLAAPDEIYINQISLNASFGIALAPVHAVDYAGLNKAADLAMYHSKRNGGNKISWYNDQVERESCLDSDIRLNLRNALDKNQFKIFFQKKYDSVLQRFCGAEALLRWEFNGTTLLPDKFIPIAEEMNLIGEIDLWVVKEVCSFVSTLPEEISTGLQFSINISSLHFEKNGAAAELRKIVSQFRIPNHQIDFELTETAQFNDAEQAIREMKMLRSFGFSITLDDFGTGYSSISYLTKFPISGIKIDKEIVQAMGENEFHDRVIKGVVDTANSLHLRVTAEGVETKRHQAIAEQIGISCFQGWLFSKAEPMLDVKWN